MSDLLQSQVEARLRIWESAKEILDRADTEKRDLSAEEKQSYERMTADLEERAKFIADARSLSERESRAAEAASSFEIRNTDAAVSGDAAMLRKLAAGEIRSVNFEHRTLTKGSTGAPVPTSFYDQVITLARTTGPMLETSTILNTAGGENLQIPSNSAYSTGAITSEGSAISASDPTMNSFVTLGAFKYGFLVQVSRELVEDTGVDLLGFVAENVGQGIGYAVNNGLTVGTGTVQPNGIVNAAGSALVGGTGVSGAFTADNLIDLAYSVDTIARRRPGAGFMMNASSIGAVRKLKDTAGNYVFQPAMSADQRDLVLGFPVFENPHIASTGTAAKSVIFGDLKSYYVRQVGGIRLDRSDDYAFNTDLVTFRATMRIDGNLPQSSHIKFFKGAAT
jgi:HK97 family phage major capsid protein